MVRWAEAHKPAARARAHLALAWLMWAIVGAVMAVVGAYWCRLAAQEQAPWFAAGAIALGALKSRTVLDRVARRTADRIVARGDGRCVGGFLSLRSWLLVLLMAVAGRLLRGAISLLVIGPLYLAVGAALLISSRVTWRAWRGKGAQSVGWGAEG